MRSPSTLDFCARRREPPISRILASYSLMAAEMEAELLSRFSSSVVALAMALSRDLMRATSPASGLLCAL